MSKEKETIENLEPENIEETVDTNSSEVEQDQTLDSETVLETDDEKEVEQIANLETEISELKADLLRQKADFENIKKRLKQENETNIKYANQQLLEQFLPILDGFERALADSEHKSEEFSQFLKGFEMLQSLLKQTLTNAGLEEISAIGEQFDPYLHQAVIQENDKSKPDNEIIEELQKGYTLNDRVVRASMVKVNQK